MFLPGFDDHRHQISTPSADLSYIDIASANSDQHRSDQPESAALFVHGIATSAYLWADAIRSLSDTKRCIAIDLPGHGGSPARPDQRMTIGALADVLAELCDGLGLEQVDLVANDTGGAVAQVFAARNPARLRTLVLTDCDTQDNIPPEAFLPTVELARSGAIVAAAPALLEDLAAARTTVFAMGYENPELLSLDMVKAFLEPAIGTPAAAGKFQELIASLDPADLVAAEPALRRLDVPTLIVWGTADDFFDLKWATWLRDTIPGAGEVIELEGAKVFFPHERAEELATAVRRHWNAR